MTPGLNLARICGNLHGMNARFLALLGVSLLLCACAPGSGEGLNVSGRPLSEGGDVPLAATLASIQVNVFDASCTVCHSGAAAPKGLRLDAGSSFTNLVGVASQEVGSLLRVEPGNPDRSYLIRKLEGTAAEGERMPLGGAPIPQATIDFVRQWILDGALPEPPAAGTPPEVISLQPAPGSVSATFPADVVAGFDQDIDASTINELTFLLLRSGGDGLFGNGNDVPVTATSIGLSGVNPRLAVMNLAGVTPVEDVYRVTLKGSGPNLVMNVDGLALDGDYVADFEIQGLQATLDSIQANIFAVSCAVAGCHSGPMGPSLPQGMDLSTADNSYDNLVGVLSVQAAPLLRVSAGDANNSYLVQKLEGTAAAGQQMPFGGTPLDQASIDVIRAWIDAGAAR